MGCNNNQKMLLDKIRQYAFTINDLALYLNTHPCDQRAIRAHKEYSNKLSDAKLEYQEEYGMLSIYYPTNSWDWVENPWPWEKGGV